MRKPRCAGKEWTREEDKKIQLLVKRNIPTTKIASQLGRTAGAVRNHAAKKGISLA